MNARRISFWLAMLASLVVGILMGLFLNQEEPGSVASQPVTRSSGPIFSGAGSQPPSLGGGMSGLAESMRRVVSRQDPEKLVADLRASRQDSYQRALLPLVMQYWADQDPNAALSYASEMDADEGRLELMALALGSMAQSDLNAALSWADKSENYREQEFLYAAAYSGYAEHRPNEAMLAAEKMTPGHGRDLATARVAEVWARTDARAVFDWIETQAMNRNLQDVYGTVMVEYMRQDPNGAGNLIQELSPGAQKTVLACQYAHLLAKSDLDAALDWVERLPDGPAKTQSLGLAVDEWLEVDPEGAFEFALGSTDAIQADLLKRVALKMATVDPAAAASSLDRFPEAVLQVVAKDVASLWATRDPEGVVHWISGLSDAHVYRQAVQGALHPLLDRSPDVAFQLAASLADESRYSLMQSAARRWHEINPDAVMDAIQTDLVLTPSQKEQLMADVSARGSVMDILLP